MRITNKIMRNNSLYNINQNKMLEDHLNNQMTNQSKITRPSDDPVVAIRALRLRTNVTTVAQYYDKNAPDADSWISLTGDALDTVGKILTDLYKQVEDSSKKSYTYADLDIVLTQMKSLTKEFYASGNVDYAGRYIFSGFRTATPITFTKEDIEQFTKDPENLRTFVIEESFGYGDISRISYTNWKDAADKYGNKDERDVENTTLYRFRMSYNNLDINLEDGEPRTIKPDELQIDMVGATPPDSITIYANSEEAYYAVANGKCDAAYIPSTGEIVFGEKYYTENCKENMSLRVKYSKSDWREGDINPVHYFHAIECDQKNVKDAMQLEAADKTLNDSLNAISKAQKALDSMRDLNIRISQQSATANAELRHDFVVEAKAAVKSLYDAAMTEFDLLGLTDDVKKEYEGLTKEQRAAYAGLTDEEKAVYDAYLDAKKLNDSMEAIKAEGATVDVLNTVSNLLRNDGILGAAPAVIEAATEKNKEYQIEVNRIRNLITEYNPDEKDQDIYYNVGFNQTIQVNTHAKEVFTHGVRRDLDDFETYLRQLQEVETTISDIKAEMEKYSEESKEYKDLQLKLDAANKAYTYIRDNVQTKFENQISKYQSYIDDVNVAVTNNGTRGSRLDLITDRLMNQKATFKDLQSSNEDVDMSEVTVQLKSAELTYEASLMATSKIMQTNLMNYI
ncbi:MAG: hypothetical protein J1E98_07205 [Lachnospiraceae bacterium]|nr:hypothetical protein [Lachnospiraceae bacterium]